MTISATTDNVFTRTCGFV